MKTILKKLDNIEKYILLITFPLMLVLVFLSTIIRYFELASIPWSEEAARYLMIWAAYAGISLGIKENSHLGISFFVKKFSMKIQKVLFVVRGFLIFLFGSIITYYSYLLISNQIANNQLSPSLGIPVWLVYLSLLFCSVMIMIRITIMTIGGIKTNNYQTEETERV